MPYLQILRHLNKITVFLTYNLQIELSLKVHSYSIEREMFSAIYQQYTEDFNDNSESGSYCVCFFLLL